MSNPEISYRTGAANTKVYLGPRIVGVIRRVEGGYRYRAYGSNLVGETFPTLAEVKQSLEGASA